MRIKFQERYFNAKKENICEHAERNSVGLSEADTFIEFCFEQACVHMKNGMSVLTEWRYHKEQYCNITNTTMYDFQHYSKHDASHSISILEAIELVVGEERIVSLSMGNLWLLLEAAYSHDMGMALTQKDLLEIWSESEFKEYLLSCLKERRVDAVEAANYYVQMDKKLREVNSLSGCEEYSTETVVFDESWPAQISYYVKILLTEYVRRQHSRRNRRARERIINIPDSIIPERLYALVVEISMLHTANEYEDIMRKLKKCEKGIGAEHINPRFAAAMLRIGDVLDVENNRFFMRAIEHMLDIPSVSRVHLNKHKAINCIQISMDEIHLEAVSEDREVCQSANEWFHLVDDEVKNLICYWNEIVPIDLQGGRLKKSTCITYLMDEKGNKRVYNSEFQKKFELEKDKLFELVKGVGIYDNELECIREYVQNAMDACKMQLWIDLREGRYEEDIAPELVKSREFMPYNIPKRIWDNYEVKIQMGSLQEETGKIKIKIQDNGIGIEDECLKVISTVGAGWRKRKKYVNEISIMPAWLKPTGGFGMGIQSAFMATDEVIIDTKTKDDYMGRRIQLEKPGSGGHIYFEEHAQKFQGTKIELEIPTEYFQSWNRSVAEDKKHLIFDEVDMKKEFMDVDIFSSEYIEESVWLVLNEYIKKTIPNPLIPLMLTRKNYRKKEVGNPFWNRSIEEDELEIKTWNDKKYAIHYGDVRISFWDIERVNFVSIGWKTDYNSVQKHKPCYKNVIVAHDDSVRVFEKFDFYIDFMGESANNALMVHRNEFSKKFRKQIEKLLVEYQKLYFHLFCELEEQSKYGYMLQDRDFAIMRMVHAEEKDVSRIKEEFHNTSYTCKCRKLYLDKSVNGEDAAQSEEISGVSERDELINFEEILAKLHELRKGCASGDIKGVCLLIKPEDKVDKEIKEEAVAQYFYPDLACENKNIVLEKLMEDGVIIDSELFNILKYYYPNSRRRYNIEEPGERIFSFFVFGDDKNGNKYSENDFYTISCPKVYEERAIIKAAVHQGKYFPLLQVDCTPKMKNEEGEGPYIISPIPQEWYEKRFNEERKISKQEFINFITGKDDKGVKEKYNNLLNWVQKHAVNKEGRNNINRIREEYNRYISMIYDNVIKKRKK